MASFLIDIKLRGLMNSKHKIEYVKNEYYENKKPKVKIIIPEGYRLKENEAEIKVAELIEEEFGGTLELLLESNKIMRPDYKWNDNFWEFKFVSSKTSIDSQVRKGIKQIISNIGGLILNVDGCNMDVKNIINGIADRIDRESIRTLKKIDVILIRSGKILDIIRYKK